MAPVEVDDNSGGALRPRPAKQPWLPPSRTQLYSHGSGPVNPELNTWTDGFWHPCGTIGKDRGFLVSDRVPLVMAKHRTKGTSTTYER